LFLQEASSPISYFTLSFEMDKAYRAEDIGHFRLFCILDPIKVMLDIKSILFGSSDKTSRTSKDTTKESIAMAPIGIKHGISGGQWEQYSYENNDPLNEDDEDKYVCVSSSSSIGESEIRFINISYRTSDFLRSHPYLSLMDIDKAWYIICLNKSLAQKIKEYNSSDFSIDYSEYTPNFPVIFIDDELSDPWVRIRPIDTSIFRIDFFSETPKRLFTSKQTINNLEPNRKSPV